MRNKPQPKPKQKPQPKPHNPVKVITFCDDFTQADYIALCRLYGYDPDKRGAFQRVMTLLKNLALNGGVK
jgi:ATP-dependent Clp protease adapter protein ClpS